MIFERTKRKRLHSGARKAGKLLPTLTLMAIMIFSIPPPALAAPPLTNDWPKFQGNLKNTGVAYPGLNGIITPTELWSFTTDNVIGPGSPVIGDVDNDGWLDVLIGTANFAGTGGIYALDGRTGTQKWKYATGDYGTYATPPLGDIDGDGKLETVFPSYAGKIIALEDDGTEKWKLDKGSAGTKSVIADVNGDGALETVAGAAGKTWLLQADGTEIWSKNFIIGTEPTIADLDGDGNLEIIFAALGTHTIVALNVADGSTKWTTPPAGQDFQMSLSITNDLNGDGKLDVVAGCRDKKVYAYSGADGTKLWDYTTVGRVFGIAVADINGDGYDDVVATATKGDGIESYVYLLNGNTGSLLWKHNIVGKNGYTTERTPSIVDVNKDGVLDVVTGSTNEKLYALSGTDGCKIWTFMLGDPSASSPAIADINGDGVMDIVIAAGNIVYAITATAGVERSKTETTPSGDYTVDALTEADAEVDKKGTGTPTVNIAKYTSNPGGDPTFTAVGKYLDVSIDDESGVDELRVRFYYTDADIAGFEESSLKVYWWTGSAWVLCDPQTLHTDAVNGYSGYIEVGPILASGTTPTLSQLVGTPFGFGGETPTPTPTPTPRPVGGVLVPMNKLAILAPYLALIGLAGAVTVVTVTLRKRST